MQAIDTSTWKEFKIGDLFDSESGNVDIKKEHINEKGYPVVSSGVDNRGIIGCADIDSKIHKADTITVDMFGNVFYRDFEYKMVTHARVFALLPKGFEINKERGNFLAACISKITSTFEYNNMCSYKKIKDLYILLPATPDSEPDWAYMEGRIAELEESHLAELEAYLISTGLNDYELTDEDQKTLAATPECGEFVASELFDIKKGKRLTKADMKEGDINFIGSSSTNNGLTAKIGNTEHLHPANTITVSYNGSVGEVFLQEEPFWASDDVNVWYPRFDFNTEVMQYIMTVIQRHREKYSYTAKWTIDKMREELLRLPVTPSGEPDWEYMEKYIRAVEKTVIADVVRYKDRMIDETKKVVGE